MKYCKNCKWLKHQLFGLPCGCSLYWCAVKSLHYSGKGKEAFTSQCNYYKRKWYKFWIK